MLVCVPAADLELGVKTMLNSLVERQKHLSLTFFYNSAQDQEGRPKDSLLLKSISRVNLFVETADTAGV